MDKLFVDVPEKKKPILEDMLQTSGLPKGRTGSGKRPEVKAAVSEGYRFIPHFRPETAKRYFEETEIENNTVFIASFPKTGTNWLLEIARQIVYGEDEKLDSLSKLMSPKFGMLEVWKPEKFDLLEHLVLPRKLFTTHLPAELMDFEKIKKSNGKVIVPIRNPKDQAISWFHFAKGPPFDSIREELSPDWSQFLLDYVEGKHPLISKTGEWYPEYLLGWYKYKNDDNVLFVHYEDLKKDPQGGIRKVADFLEVKVTGDRVADIVKATSFESMKKAQDTGKGEKAKMLADAKMMRKGEAGAWKNTFTVAQSEMVDKIIEEKLGHTDIKFRYE